MLLVGTKCDLWRERQINVQLAQDFCTQFGCVQFKEISTKENLDEVRHFFSSFWLIECMKSLARSSLQRASLWTCCCFSCCGSIYTCFWQVKSVFELALRQGWLFRQHRELTKHRNLTLYSAGQGQDLCKIEKASSFDSRYFYLSTRSKVMCT